MSRAQHPHHPHHPRRTQHLLDAIWQLDARLEALHGRRRYLVLGLFLLLTLVPYLYGTWLHHEHVNKTVYWADQGDYYYYAARLDFTDGSYAGDFNRTPLYPWLQSLLYQEGEHPQDFWARGVALNVAFSLLLLLALFAYFLHDFRTLTAMNLYLIVAFMIFVFKAAYTHAELLYYGLAFFAFVLMLRQLIAPRWGLAVLLGLIAPLAQLTKGSMLPGLLLFAAISVVQGLVWWRDDPQRARESLGQLVLSGAMFLVALFPYLQVSAELFGSPFYNVNTTLYMWEDDWQSVKDGVMQARPDLRYPETLPNGEAVPTLRHYLHEHSFEDLLSRSLKGLWVTAKQHTNTGYGYQWYLYGALALVVLLAGLAQRRGYELGADLRENWAPTLFVLGYFGGYLLLYAFYVPIQPGKRFALALYLPALWLLLRLLDHRHFEQFRWRRQHFSAPLHSGLFVLLLIHSAINLFYAVSRFPGA